MQPFMQSAFVLQVVTSTTRWCSLVRRPNTRQEGHRSVDLYQQGSYVCGPGAGPGTCGLADVPL
jgi:hypothetical protein